MDSHIQIFFVNSEGFYTNIYIEALEESSFLYEHRISLLIDKEISWSEIGSFEIRFEAYLDLLVIGGDLALQVLRERAGEGDFGELHVAVRLFCRKGRRDLIDEVIEGLDFDDEERVTAVCDALCIEPCDVFQEAFLNSLFEMGGNYLIIAASIIAFKRVSLEKRLLEVLKHYPSDKKITPALLYAISRLRPSNVGGDISPLFKDEDETVVHAAINALVRMGEEGFTRSVPFEVWPVITHGLCGGSKNFSKSGYVAQLVAVLQG